MFDGETDADTENQDQATNKKSDDCVHDSPTHMAILFSMPSQVTSAAATSSDNESLEPAVPLPSTIVASSFSLKSSILTAMGQFSITVST